jgi:hypothetical protein
VNYVFDAFLQTAARDAERRARRLMLITMLGFASGLMAVAGIGFVTAWAFLTLSVSMGPGLAALLIGLGLFGLAGAVLAFAVSLASKPAPKLASEHKPETADPGKPDAVAVIAFTAAFVLGRYLTRSNRA